MKAGSCKCIGAENEKITRKRKRFKHYLGSGHIDECNCWCIQISKLQPTGFAAQCRLAKSSRPWANASELLSSRDSAHLRGRGSQKLYRATLVCAVQWNKNSRDICETAGRRCTKKSPHSWPAMSRVLDAVDRSSDCKSSNDILYRSTIICICTYLVYTFITNMLSGIEHY